MASRAAASLRKNVGRRVAELRVQRGLTQERLAERLGVSIKYQQTVEAGGENLTLDSLARLAAALAVPVTALFAAARTSPRPGRPRNVKMKR